MKRIHTVIIAGVLALAVAAGFASAAQISPQDTAHNTGYDMPAYTTRYQVIDDMVALQNRIADLEYQITELRWLRAHDVQQREVFRAADLKTWRDARIEDQKRITSLEVTQSMICR